MRVGVLIIGQTPRPDLMALVGEIDAEWIVRGALDGPPAARLVADLLSADADPTTAARPRTTAGPTAHSTTTAHPTDAGYPLVTRLSDGRAVTADQAALEPLLQRHLDDLDSEGVDAHILLCAGSFPGLRSRRPLLHPFRLGASTLTDLGVRALHVLVPTREQLVPGSTKWSAAGFRVTADVFSPRDPTAAPFPPDTAEAVVFDFVGLDRAALSSLASAWGRPVLDLGHHAASTLNSLTFRHA